MVFGEPHGHGERRDGVECEANEFAADLLFLAPEQRRPEQLLELLTRRRHPAGWIATVCGSSGNGVRGRAGQSEVIGSCR